MGATIGSRVSLRELFLSHGETEAKRRDADEVVSPTGLWTQWHIVPHPSSTHLGSVKVKEISRI